MWLAARVPRQGHQRIFGWEGSSYGGVGIPGCWPRRSGGSGHSGMAWGEDLTGSSSSRRGAHGETLGGRYLLGEFREQFPIQVH